MKRIALSIFVVGAIAANGQDIPFYEYDPPSTLVVPETNVTRSKYPFVDVHNHQFSMADQDLGNVVEAMDELNMAVMVNLSGRGFVRLPTDDGGFRYTYREEDYASRSVANGEQSAPGRFVVFTNLDLEGLGSAGWLDQALAQLGRDVAGGSRGLKIYKSLGLGATDAAGERIAVNDSRLDPIWSECGELGIPVLIHSGEPASFWHPKDGNNERLFEMIEKPERWRDPAVVASWEQVMGEQRAVFRAHPETTFITAHLGWLGNDLVRLGQLLDELPNVYTEIGAVIAEIGRQPRVARRFFLEYQDRILFGKDTWAPEEYHVYFRVLETQDDYFPYYRRRHAFWRLYGLGLPDQVLRKVYYENALKIIPGLDEAAILAAVEDSVAQLGQ